VCRARRQRGADAAAGLQLEQDAGVSIITDLGEGSPYNAYPFGPMPRPDIVP
jgi:hypothetical protein